MGQFSAGPINKAVQSFTSSSTPYMNSDRRHSKHLSLLKKSVRTYGVCAVLNS